MQVRWFVAIVGGALLLVGGILGSAEVTARMPITRAGDSSCGSAFDPGPTGAWGLPGEPERRAGACEEAIGSRAAFAWVLIGGGIVLAVGGVILRPGSGE